MVTGLLRQQAVLQSRTVTAFRGGSFTVSWNTVSTVWCSVNWDSREAFDNVKEQEFDSGVICIRAGMTISKDNRFIFNKQILHLEGAVDKTNRGNILKIKFKCEVV
jgi:head-tail adaptor